MADGEHTHKQVPKKESLAHNPDTSSPTLSDNTNHPALRASQGQPLTPADILRLQSTHGNRFVQRMLGITPVNSPKVVQLARGKLVQSGNFSGGYAVVIQGQEYQLNVSGKIDRDFLRAVIGQDIEYDDNNGQYSLNIDQTEGLYPHLLSGTPTTPSAPAVPDDEQKDTTSKPKKYSKAELERHQEAYRKARMFHGTKPDNVDKIKKEGLKTDYAGTGDDPEKDDRRWKVYLGSGADVSLPYAKNDTQNMARVLRPPEEMKRHPGGDHVADSDQFKNLKNQQHLWYDRNGGYVTGKNVAPESMYFGSNTGMLQTPQADHLLGIIAQHYDGTPPSPDELKQIHQQAIEGGYISDTPGDDHTTNTKFGPMLDKDQD
jgi:hypothetical protein